MMSSFLHWLPYFALAAVLAQCAVLVIRPDFLFGRKMRRRFRFGTSGPGVDRVVADVPVAARQSEAAQLSLAELLKARPPR
jgi:hypothetical protein